MPPKSHSSERSTLQQVTRPDLHRHLSTVVRTSARACGPALGSCPSNELECNRWHLLLIPKMCLISNHLFKVLSTPCTSFMARARISHCISQQCLPYYFSLTLLRKEEVEASNSKSLRAAFQLLLACLVGFKIPSGKALQVMCSLPSA